MTNAIDVQQVIDLLTAYLPAILPYLWKGTVTAGKAVSEKIGEDAWEKTKQIANALRPKIKKDITASELVKTALAQPDNSEALVAVQNQLQMMLSTDKALTTKLINLLGKSRAGDTYEGNVFHIHDNSGDVTLRYYELDYAKLSSNLKKSFPKDPTADRLLENLKTFRVIHEHLGEWKHVHNYMTDIMIAMDVFLPTIKPRGVGIYTSSDDFDLFMREWNQVKWRVDGLQSWSTSIKRIGKPFIESDNQISGEPWVVEIVMVARNLNTQMVPVSFSRRRREVYVTSNELHSKISSFMYLADKHILEMATQLQTISQFVFGKMK